ncbi:MAG: hypothetical protein LUC91_02100, partial [Prevotella sp.]|nr:hypothetical protein [Prevotella sp.]
VEALESITIICEDGMWWSWIGEITATKDGEAYELNITEDDMVAGEDDGANGDPSRMTIYLNITEAGEYVITIPEGYFIVGSDAANSDEIVLTYTVEGETTGINGVTLKATDNDRFYNLNGQRVTSPRNGIFILNGKKVLVK